MAHAEQQSTPSRGNEGLDEIVVTAERRSESVQSVPIAITAIAAADLTSRGVKNVQDLEGLAPATQFQTNQNDSLNVSIRGITTNNVQIVGDTAIAYNYDGVPVIHSVGQPAGLFDMDRIEILRGPQGTLYGRNSTGGAINFITHPPVLNEDDAEFSATYGNYALVDVAGMANVALGSALALRTDVQYTKHSSYTGDGFNDQDTKSARVSALYDPGSIFRIELGADYSKQGGQGAGFSACPPGSGQAGPALAISGGPVLIPNYCANFSWNPYHSTLRDSHTDLSFVDIDNYGIHAEVDVDLPFGTLTYIPGYRDVKQSALSLGISTFTSPLAGGDYVHVGNDIVDDKNHTITQELRLGSPSESTLKWVAGIFYLHDDVKDYRDSLSNLPIEGPLTPGIRAFDQGRQALTTDSYAGFTQATYPIVDAVRITGGLRYTKDREESSGVTNVINADGSILPVPAAGSLSFDKVTWRAGIDADIAAHSLLFGTVSTGYKAGGFNPGIQPSLFPAETITAYELGIKNDFLDRTLRLNLTAFYYDYKNYQFEFFGNIDVPNPAGGAPLIIQQTVTAPAAKVTDKGVELETVYRPWTDSTLSLNASYLDATFSEFSYQGQDYSGNSLPFAPKATVSGAIEQIFHLASGGRLVGRLSSLYNSRQFAYFYSAPGSVQGAYTRTDASLAYEPTSSKLTVTGWARNLENDYHMTQYLTQSPFNPTVALVGAPRTYGVTIDVKF
jgi:iron complex outermembrane receptor protein